MKFDAVLPCVENARVLNVDWGCTRYILDRKTRDDFEALVLD